MRIGPNASYQAIGTVMHEMAHGIGVGTHNNWSNSSIYRENTSRGYWNGARVDRVLQFLENSSTARLTGDNTHMWPYGINGAQEDNHTMILYYANGLIVEALGEDNLPPTDGAFATPAYTFVQEMPVNMQQNIELIKLHRRSHHSILVKVNVKVAK